MGRPSGSAEAAARPIPRARQLGRGSVGPGRRSCGSKSGATLPPLLVFTALGAVGVLLASSGQGPEMPLRSPDAQHSPFRKGWPGPKRAEAQDPWGAALWAAKKGPGPRTAPACAGSAEPIRLPGQTAATPGGEGGGAPTPEQTAHTTAPPPGARSLAHPSPDRSGQHAVPTALCQAGRPADRPLPSTSQGSAAVAEAAQLFPTAARRPPPELGDGFLVLSGRAAGARPWLPGESRE